MFDLDDLNLTVILLSIIILMLRAKGFFGWFGLQSRLWRGIHISKDAQKAVWATKIIRDIIESKASKFQSLESPTIKQNLLELLNHPLKVEGVEYNPQEETLVREEFQKILKEGVQLDPTVFDRKLQSEGSLSTKPISPTIFQPNYLDASNVFQILHNQNQKYVMFSYNQSDPPRLVFMYTHLSSYITSYVYRSIFNQQESDELLDLKNLELIDDNPSKMIYINILPGINPARSLTQVLKKQCQQVFGSGVRKKKGLKLRQKTTETNQNPQSKSRKEDESSEAAGMTELSNTCNLIKHCYQNERGIPLTIILQNIKNHHKILQQQSNAYRLFNSIPQASLDLHTYYEFTKTEEQKMTMIHNISSRMLFPLSYVNDDTIKLAERMLKIDKSKIKTQKFTFYSCYEPASKIYYKLWMWEEIRKKLLCNINNMPEKMGEFKRIFTSTMAEVHFPGQLSFSTLSIIEQQQKLTASSTDKDFRRTLIKICFQLRKILFGQNTKKNNTFLFQRYEKKLALPEYSEMHGKTIVENIHQKFNKDLLFGYNRNILRDFQKQNILETVRQKLNCENCQDISLAEQIYQSQEFMILSFMRMLGSNASVRFKIYGFYSGVNCYFKHIDVEETFYFLSLVDQDTNNRPKDAQYQGKFARTLRSFKNMLKKIEQTGSDSIIAFPVNNILYDPAATGFQQIERNDFFDFLIIEKEFSTIQLFKIDLWKNREKFKADLESFQKGKIEMAKLLKQSKCEKFINYKISMTYICNFHLIESFRIQQAGNMTPEVPLVDESIRFCSYTAIHVNSSRDKIMEFYFKIIRNKLANK